MKFLSTFLVVVASEMTFQSLNVGHADAPAASHSSTANIVNPASHVCSRAGGKTEFYLDGRGDEIGICRLKAALVDEWTLWRVVDLGDRQLALDAFRNNVLKGKSLAVRTAPELCEDVHAKFVTFRAKEKPASAKVVPFCVFKDKSTIGLETLLGGPKVHAKLKETLPSAP